MIGNPPFFSFSLLHSGSTRRARASWATGFAWSTCKFLFFPPHPPSNNKDRGIKSYPSIFIIYCLCLLLLSPPISAVYSFFPDEAFRGQMFLLLSCLSHLPCILRCISRQYSVEHHRQSNPLESKEF